jgi:hypothetical protein
MARSVAPDPEIVLPPKPGRRFLVVALIVLIGGTLGGLIGIFAQASSFRDVHQFEPTAATPVTLLADRDYELLVANFAGVTCAVLDPAAQTVELRQSVVDFFVRKFESRSFTSGEAGSYRVDCAGVEAGNTVLILPADVRGRIALVVLLAALTVFCLVVGALLVIIALVVRSRALKRWEEEKAEFVAAALARRSPQPQSRARPVYLEFPRE